MKKKILIPIFILIISLVAVVTASWQILNFKENKVPSEYFPYEVNAVQNVIYNGQEHDVTITLTEGSVVDNNDLIIEYYRYSTSIDKDDVIHNITLLQNEKPKHSGIYIAKIYRMVDVTTEDRGVTQEKEEIYNVRLNINKRQVIVSSYADRFIYFGQDTTDVTFGYDIEQALEGSDRGLVAGDELKESSSFVLDAGYKKYQTYGVCTIAISGLYDVNDNYEIIYNPGEFHVKQLPISFSWDTNSLKTIYSGKYQRPSIGTYSTSVEGVDMEELLQNVKFNAIYDTDTNKLINAGLYDVTCTGFDNPNFIFDESGSTDYKDTAFEIEKCKVNYSWYTDSEQKLIFNGESQHQKAYLTSIVDGIDVEMVVDSFKLLENESNNGERDTTYINYKTSGEVEANVNKNGDKLYSDLYTIELLSLSNPNYEFAEGNSSTTYKIYPKELTLAWHEDNSFVFSNKPQIVEADEIGLIDNYPSGLYFDGAETNANYINEETMIPSYTNSDNEVITFNKYYSTAQVTSTNYYLADNNIKKEFKITQLEVFITWGSQVEFVYNGQMNSHCPTGSIALETGYPDAGLMILGSEVNANSDHLGNKYNGFADYMAQAKISNTNYKLLENTTCDFKVKASPLVVGINEDLPEGAVSSNSTSYSDITYEYFGQRFIPTGYYEGTLYGNDTCSVDVKYVKDNGTLSAEGALDVGTYLAKTVGLTNTNYSIVEEKSINVVINPRPIYISWGNLSFDYDSESHLPTVSISNLCDIDIPTDPNADPLVYVRVDNSFAQTNANITYTGGNLIAGFNRYPVSLTSNNITNEAGEVVKNYLVYGSRGHNYICSTESLCENTFTIRQAQLTINALKNEIIYGDVPSLSKTSHIELVGLKPNDTIDSLTNLTYDINYKQFDDVTNALKNVSYEASWTGVTNTNYEITYNSAEFVVNKKPVTISWDTVTTHVYSSSLWAPAANIIGLVNNDNVSVEIAGKQKDTNVKTGLTYNASVTKLISDDSLDQADNYIISNPDTTQQFTITQKPVTINWTKINLTYTSGLQFAHYEFVGVLNNEDLLETISGKQTDANKNSKGVFGSAYIASITEIGNLNYMFATDADKEEEFYINALGITVNWITPEFSYKGKLQLPTISSLSTIYDSDISSVSTNITASSESTIDGFIAGIWAGSHKATARLTGAKASNYEIIGNETFDYNISRAPLEIILNSNTIIYGDAPVDNGYTIKGFENGETVAVLGNSISYTHSYSQYGNIGDYAINASGFTSNNYEITYRAATLTVEARKVEITFTDLDSYVYKKGEYSPIATVTNLAKADDVCTVVLTTFSNVGEHTSVVKSISNSNYTIEGTSYSHKFTITPKPITINWSGTSGLIYDSTVQEISAGSNDIIDGDTVTYTITYTLGDGKNAGSHTAKVEIDNPNYTIAANETKPYTIERKEITIVWTNLEFTYEEGKTYCPTATAKGLLGDDTCELTVEGAASAVGQHTATVTEISNTNYKLPANTSTTFEILPAETTTTLTVTIYGNVTIKYGDDLVLEYTTQAPTGTQSKVYYTISGFRDGDSINSLGGQLSLTTNYINNVGTYTITSASGFTHDSYEFEYVIADDGQITVKPRIITIDWTDLTPEYIGVGQFPDYTLSGVVNDECDIKFVDDKGVEIAKPKDCRQYLLYIALTNTDGNYELSEERVLFTIVQREVDIEWTTSGLVYTGSPINVATLTNIASGDNVTPVFNKQVKDAGTYTVTITSLQGTNSGNYKLPTEGLSATFRVEKAIPEITTLPTLPSIFEGQSLNNSQISGGVATLNGIIIPGTFEFDNVKWDELTFNPDSNKVDTTQTVKVKFIPTNHTNYDYTTGYVTISINAVASIGYQGIYYGSVEAALNAASSGAVIYVLPNLTDTSGNMYIPILKANDVNKGIIEVKSGVTLLLPYQDAEHTYRSGYGYYDKIGSGGTNKVASCLKIESGVTLNVNGTLNISAYLNSSGTVSDRGVIMNEGIININSGAYLFAYGYLKGENGIVNVNAGATYTDVFKIYDWYGGKNAYGANQVNVMPFQCYSFHNVSCKVIIFAGSLFQGYAAIEASGGWMLDQMLTLVGNSNTSSSLFILTSGRLERTVEDTTDNTYFNTDYDKSNQDIRQREVLKFYGEFCDGVISISAKMNVVVTDIEIDINTSHDLAMPISFLHIYAMKGSKGTLSVNSYKVLPGSLLYVDEDADVKISNANVKVTIYDEYPDDFKYIDAAGEHIGVDNPYSYRNTHSAIYNSDGTIKDGYEGRIVVAGKLTCDGYIGGYIEGVGNGEIRLSKNYSSIRLLNTLEYDGAKLLYVVPVSKAELRSENECKVNATGTINGNLNQVFDANKTYYYNENTDSWGTPITISFVTNCDQTIADITSNSGTSGYALPENILNGDVLEKRYYNLEYWYYINKDGEEVQYDGLLYESCTLYAKWIPKNYNIDYDLDNYDDSATPDGEVTNNSKNPTQFNIESNITLLQPTHSLQSQGYKFEGWYYDAGLTEKVTNSRLNINKLLEIMGGNTSVILYAKWYLGSVEINYVNSNADEKVTTLLANSPQSAPTNIDKFKTTDIEDFADLNNDLQYGWHFEGWYLDAEFTQRIDSFANLTNDQISEYIAAGSITLYAKWVQKYQVNLSTNADVTDNYHLNYSFIFVYLNDSNSYPLDYEVLTTFKAGEKDTNYKHYFMEWRADPSGTVYTSLTKSLFDSTKEISIIAYCGTKFKVTISELHGNDSLVSKEEWYMSGTEISIEFNDRTSNSTPYFLRFINVNSTTKVENTSSQVRTINTTINSDTTINAVYLRIVYIKLEPPGKGWISTYDLSISVTGLYSTDGVNFTQVTGKECSARGTSGNGCYVLETSTFTGSTDWGGSVYVNDSKLNGTYTVGTVDLTVKRK